MSQPSGLAISLPGSRSVVRATIRDHAWTVVVSAAVVGWALSLFLRARGRYEDFAIGRYDLGNMVQAVWSTAHGHILEVTEGYTGEQMIRIGSHVDPILVFLTPFWVAAPSPKTLIAIQVCAVALGAFALFALGRTHLGPQPGAFLALAYLAYPWTGWTAVDALHPVTLAIPLYLACVWALDSDRLVLFAIAAALAALTGELMALPIAALGVWYAVARGRRRAGMLIAAAGVGWVVLSLYVLVPAISGGASVFYGLYRGVGSSPTGLLKNLVTDPLSVLSEATRPGDLLYIALLAIPLGGLFVLAPGLAAVSVPQLSANTLAAADATTDPHAHYIAAVVPFLFAAICVGLARSSEKAKTRGAILVLVLCVAATCVAGPWPRTPGTPPGYWDGIGAERTDILRQAIQQVPSGVPVSSTNEVGAMLSARRYVYSVPVIGRARWVVVDATDSWIPQAVGGFTDPARLRAFRQRLARDPAWNEVFESDGVFVFRRLDG